MPPIPSSASLQGLFPEIEPIDQNDGPNPVCSIQYSSTFREAMGYLRAILQLDERSERSLFLTQKCLRLNQANYTTWHFRRNCLSSISQKRQEGLEATDKVLYLDNLVQKDLEMATRLGGPNPKNYQIWYHRRALLEEILKKGCNHEESSKTIGAAENELEYIESVLEEDSKNYHAWSHRQWVLSSISSEGHYTKELSFIHKLLLSDVRNNSAWNQRWFASHKGRPTIPLTKEHALEEAEYAWSCIVLDVWNESPFRYFLGVGKEQCAKRDGYGTWEWDEWEKKLEILAEEEESPCYILMSAQVDILELIGKKESRTKAANIARSLSVEHDTIRKNYWRMREKQLREEEDTCEIA